MDRTRRQLRNSPSYSPTAVAYNGTRFVTVNSGEFDASTDARIWSTTPDIGNTVDVAWNGQIFVAVGNSTFVDTSPDGLTWTLSNKLPFL